MLKPFRKKFGAVLILLLGASLAAAQTVSPEERKIVDYVDANTDQAIAFIEKVVNIDSATLNLKGVRRVSRVFEEEFESLGFTTKWVELPKEMNRAGHMFAERKGTRGKRLLLIGHLDTVLEGDRFRREGKIARGSGTVDMKAGNAVVLFALKALQSVGALDNTQTIVAFTGDEELPGLPVDVTRRELIEAAKRSDIALGFEGGAGDTATIARRGSSIWKLEVSGVTAHSSGIFGPNTGSGAIFEASRILNAFHEQLRGEQYLTFSASLIVGGTDTSFDAVERRGTAAGKPNVIPKTVTVEGDLRFISTEQRLSAQARMRDIVAKNLPRTRAQITFQDFYPAMSPRKENYEILQILDKASQDLGLGKVEAYDPGRRGAGDISFVADLIPGLDGLGARGGGAHEPTEFMELDSLPLVIKRAALLIYRLTR